jgi:short-subunit dehydrogenase
MEKTTVESTSGPRTALITGASRGIGLALARRLARGGWRVALTSRSLEVLEREASAIGEAGGEAIAIRCDAGNLEEVRAAVGATLDRWGGIDLAVANAGVGALTPASKFPISAAESMIRTNLLGTMYLFAAAVPPMIARGGGQFAAVASLAGLRGIPGSSSYSASKAAMQTFLDAVRVELAPRGIAVTTINPGFVETEMTASNRFPMPFLMGAEKAAEIIVRGLERRSRIVEFPLAISLVLRGSRLLPMALIDRIFALYLRRLKKEKGDRGR